MAERATDAPTRPTTVEETVRRALRGRRFDVRQLLFQGTLLLALLLSLAILVTLVADVAVEGVPLLAERGLDFFTAPLSSIPQEAGIQQGLVGSLLLMVFVILLAFPLGVGAAVYMEEYASDNRFTRFVNANIRNLAGVPSIVYGLLGLAIFVRAMTQITGPSTAGKSLLSGGLTLAVMILPIVIITSSEAIRAVPNGIREAGFGVGATRWEVIRSHVLPYAAPGILTGTVLALARAFGETAPLILVGAVTGFLASAHDSLLETAQGRFTALPVIIFRWSTQPDSDFRALTAAAILVLMGLIFVVNLTGIILRNRYERSW